MKTFVINLKRSHLRREHITKQLNSLGIDFEISEGVDAKNFTADEKKAYQDGLAQGTHSLEPGLFGSSWAHIRVYEKMVAENIPVALVLEDDILVFPEIKRVLEESWVKKDFWDFVHLGYQPASLALLRNWFRVSYNQARKRTSFWFVFILKIPVITSLYLFEMIRQLIRSRLKPGPVKFARSLYLGAGYLITLEGAKKILKIAYPIHYTGDQLFNRARFESGLKFYGYCPPPVLADTSFVSDAAQASVTV